METCLPAGRLVYTMVLGRCGEIGIHVRFRSVWGNPWRSESSQRHFFATLFYVVLLFLLLSTQVLAQDSNDLLDKYRTDYFYQRDIYQQNYQQYLNKKCFRPVPHHHLSSRQGRCYQKHTPLKTLCLFLFNGSPHHPQ